MNPAGSRGIADNGLSPAFCKCRRTAVCLRQETRLCAGGHVRVRVLEGEEMVFGHLLCGVMGIAEQMGNFRRYDDVETIREVPELARKMSLSLLPECEILTEEEREAVAG